MSAFSPSMSPPNASSRLPAGAPSPAQPPAKPGAQVAADPGWQGGANENPWALAAVGALHVVLIGWLAHTMSQPKPVVPPALVGMLVQAPPVVEPVPLPISAEPIKPVPKPVPRPKPLPPPPVAAPSERAVSAPPPEPVAPPSPEPVVAAAPAPSPPAPAPAPVAAPEPLIPPRSDAAHLHNPETPYPAVSRRLGEQGTVLMSVYILADGTAGDIKLKRSSGYPRLDQIALESVRKWRFQPARRGNEAIAMWYDQPLSFSLDR